MFACFLLGAMGLAVTVGLLDVLVLHADAIMTFGPGQRVARADWSAVGRRRHQMHVNDFEPQGGDPLHEADEGCSVWELGMEGCCARADGDRALVELCPQDSTRLASESDLIRVRWHWAASLSLLVPLAASMPGGPGRIVIHLW